MVCDYEIFENLIKERNLKVSDVAKSTGIPHPTFTDWKKKRSKPKMDKLMKIADFLKVPLSTFMGIDSQSFMVESTRPYQPTATLPILGTISAGLPLYAQQNIIGYYAIEVPHDEAEYFILKVKGDSMTSARIYDGDLLVIRRQSMVENGDIAIVLVGEDEATVKRFYQDGNKITLVPQSMNPEYKPMIYDAETDSICILGKVIQIIIGVK